MNRVIFETHSECPGSQSRCVLPSSVTAWYCDFESPDFIRFFPVTPNAINKVLWEHRMCRSWEWVCPAMQFLTLRHRGTEILLAA